MDSLLADNCLRQHLLAIVSILTVIVTAACAMEEVIEEDVLIMIQLSTNFNFTHQ